MNCNTGRKRKLETQKIKGGNKTLNSSGIKNKNKNKKKTKTKTRKKRNMRKFLNNKKEKKMNKKHKITLIHTRS